MGISSSLPSRRLIRHRAGRPWSLRGRIGARGAATWLETSTGGGGSSGALPFEDLGWQKLGHFGSVGWGESHGLVSRPRKSLHNLAGGSLCSHAQRSTDGGVGVDQG
jgi:hypothetical protein